MYSLWSYSFSGEAIFRALSWTLIHSLWQGLLLSFVAGSIIFFSKKVKPSVRYNLLVISLVIFIIGVVATFIRQLEPVNQVAELTGEQVSLINRIENSAGLRMNTIQSWTIIQTNNFINANAIWIVSIWFLIIVLKFIRLSTGLYNVYQLKNRQVFSAGAHWNERITELCQQLKINKKVKLLQSAMVTIPSVIGYFKPVILFPAAMLSALSVHEVEAILIHELGHIRRNDFVVNLLQNIIETILFFNPAVIWVSTLIKTERENCCDDIAISNSNNMKAYINALLKFQDFSQSAPHLSIAFSGKKNHLLNRVERIIYHYCPTKI